jgi:hypothetical protein
MNKIALLVCIASISFAEINYDAGVQSGRITYYDQSPTVACDIPTSEWPQYTSALYESGFSGGLACGATARLMNNGKEIQVMIVDLCPVKGNEQWCSGDKPHFDLGGANTFTQLEPPVTGVKDITFEWIPTPVGNTPVKLRYKDGINAWWVAIQVLNHRYPVAKLEIQDPATSQWRTGNNTLEGMWNYWQFDFTGNGLKPPFKIRITDQYGQVIEESATLVQEKYQWNGEHQFPLLPRHGNQTAVTAPSVSKRNQSDIMRGNSIFIPSAAKIQVLDPLGRSIKSFESSAACVMAVRDNRPGMVLIAIKSKRYSVVMRSVSIENK